jgi:glucose/arabinose dehydrogenase
MSICQLAALGEAWLAAGFCAGTIPVPIQLARSVEAIGPTDFLTLERGTSSVVIVEDLDNDGIPESRRTLVSLLGLNHGFALTPTHLYASTSSDVYRWQYDPVTKNITSSEEAIISNLDDDGTGDPSTGTHRTRTLVWEATTSTLYVSVGSKNNIDSNSFRARIRRFPITDTTVFPIDFTTGEVFADGVRNEVAIEFSPKDGTLWGAGNSGDLLFRLDLGGAIYNDNPSEELHRFSSTGRNYGYPYCWREYSLPVFGLGRGTAWAYPSSNFSDDQCRNDFDKPLLAMQPHSAPLGITFYDYQDQRPSECNGVIPFPPEMDGYIFIAFHGSWNRLVPTGYKIVYIPTTADGTSIAGGEESNPVDLLAHSGGGAQWTDGFRPVDVSFDACGRLLVSSDGSGSRGSKIVRIESTSATLILPPPPETVGLFRRLLGTLSGIFFRLLSIIRRIFS